MVALPPFQSQRPPDIRLIIREGPTAAMRGSWADPDDMTPSARKSARLVTGHRTFCPLRWCLKRHGSQSSITPEHIAAADILRGHVDLAVIGRGGVWWPEGLMLGMAGHLYGTPSGPSATAVGNLRSYRAARRALALYRPQERRLMTFVVLLNNAIARWVATQVRDGQKTDAHTEQVRLVGCLDRLVAHYASEVDKLISRGWAA